MQDLVIFMLKQYHAIAYTQNYIIGFAYKKMVYIRIVDSKTVTHMYKLDKTSGGCGCSVRFSPKSNSKKVLIKNVQILCSLNEFEIMVKQMFSI